MTGLVIVLLLQGSVLWATGLYKGLWRFASFQDLWNIARASTFGTVAIVAVLALAQGSVISQWMPAILIYPVLLFVLLGLPRMCYRFWKDSRISLSTPETTVFSHIKYFFQSRCQTWCLYIIASDR